MPALLALYSLSALGIVCWPPRNRSVVVLVVTAVVSASAARFSDARTFKLEGYGRGVSRRHGARG